jgi:hypothetical protein
MNGTIQYTIRPYDTIWMLAQIFNTTVDSIMELNPGIDPRNLMIGQVITIRPGYQYYPSFSGTPSNQSDRDRVDQNRMDQDRTTQNRMDQNRIDQNMMDDMDSDFMDLHDYIRLLWDQHAEWTRMTVMGLVHNLPEADLITQRLLRNPMDFADALAPFYGEANAQKFGQLLTDHLTIAAEIVKASIANDNNTVNDADKRWRANAEEIASFLASLNQYWNEEDWSAMLNEHLDLLSENIDQMVSGDYADSIEGYDEIELQALEMADVMSEGIVLQFPE